MQHRSDRIKNGLRDGVRHNIRRRLNLVGRVTTPSFITYDVLVIELSRQGCRIQVEADLPMGTCVVVEMPGAGSVKGSVVWLSREELEIAFQSDLIQRAVDQAVELG